MSGDLDSAPARIEDDEKLATENRLLPL